MNRPLEKIKYPSDEKILLLAQFIDVLEIIEKYETIEEIRKDIIKRKKYIKNEIHFVEKKSGKDGCYDEKDILEMLKQIQSLADHNELSYIKDYVVIMLEDYNGNINKLKNNKIC